MTAKLKWLFALGFVLVFIAGIATGVFAGAWRAKQVLVSKHQDEPHNPRMTERMMGRFERELHLTPEQLEQTRPIFEDTARKLTAIREETGRRVTATLAESHQQMTAYLTPEQQEQLKEMKPHLRHRLKFKRKGQHRGRGGREHREPRPERTEALEEQAPDDQQ